MRSLVAVILVVASAACGDGNSSAMPNQPGDRDSVGDSLASDDDAHGDSDANADGNGIGDNTSTGDSIPADDSPGDAAGSAELALPAVIDLPYVVAGALGSEVSVTVENLGTGDALGPQDGNLVWRVVGSSSITVASAPAVVAAQGNGSVMLAYSGCAAEEIVRATLEVDTATTTHAVPVFAVCGSSALADAAFEPVLGAGQVVEGYGATVAMPTAPFPDSSGIWTDDSVYIFVPESYRPLASVDLVVHFHSHNTTLASAVSSHRLAQHLYASGANAVLVVPQGPVNAASGNFGKLMAAGGLSALVDEVLVVLYREEFVTQPTVGDLALTAHGGGGQAVATNLGVAQSYPITQVGLFDAMYNNAQAYCDFALAGGRLRSVYSPTGGTLTTNQAAAACITTGGLAVVDQPSQRALCDDAVVIYEANVSFANTTRFDGAYGEQLRFGLRHSRRGPRVELRQAVSASGMATVSWLSPPDADLTGFRVEAATDGMDWSVVAEAGPNASEVSFAFSGGADVRVMPVVVGLDPAESRASDVYHMDDDGNVLVVDGFDRILDGSYSGLAHNFAALVGVAAGAVTTVSHRAVSEDGLNLDSFAEVLWLLGDESNLDQSLSPAEQTILANYLAQGGHVIISGSELAYDLDHLDNGTSFIHDILGVSYSADDSGSYTASGAGPLAALTSFDYGGVGAPYEEDYPDVLAAMAGAEVILNYATATPAGAGFPGQTAVVGFPIELVDSPADLSALVAALRSFVAP